MGVRERQYDMRESQHGGGGGVGGWNRSLKTQLANAIGNALKDLILENGIPLEDRVYFGLHSNRLTNSTYVRLCQGAARILQIGCVPLEGGLPNFQEATREDDRL